MGDRRVGPGVTLLSLLALALVSVGTVQAAPAAEEAARRGHDLYEKEDYAGAMSAFDEAMAGGIRDGRLLYKAAYCQRATGKPIAMFRETMSDAVTELDRVVMLTPDKAGFEDHFYLSAAYAAIGDRANTASTARAALDAYRNGRFGSLKDFTPANLLRLGQLAGDGGDPTLQLEALTRASNALLKTDSPRKGSLALALTDLAKLHLEARRTSDALQAIEKVMALKPDQPGAREVYARTLYREKNYLEAAEQWRLIRAEDPRRATESMYNMHLMRTLAQRRLLDGEKPLESLNLATQQELEQKMVDYITEIRGLAEVLPEDVLKRGMSGQKADDEIRAATRRLRDLKYRLTWVAAEYGDRGYPLREFAFGSGVQGILRAWRLPSTASRVDRDQLIIPEWLSEDALKQVEAAEQKRLERRKRRRAEGKGKRRAAGKDDSGS